MSRATWRGVVKIQRSLAPVRDATMLVTSEDGSIYYQTIMERRVQLWLGREPKRYCRADLRGTIINLQLAHPVGDQDW